MKLLQIQKVFQFPCINSNLNFFTNNKGKSQVSQRFVNDSGRQKNSVKIPHKNINVFVSFGPCFE